MLTARHWLELWQQLGVRRDADNALADTYAALIARYAEKHRRYHTALHISECLAHFETARSLCEHPQEVELALWFHDAIYEPQAKDNEEKSAQWALRVMTAAGIGADACQRVHALIMKTCHDALPQSPDEQVLVDIDLAILGAEAGRFDEYENQVRAEYGWVPQFLFNRARKKILQGFLAHSPLYATAHFRQKLEKKARDNLTRSIFNIR
jgi:predicted metal-dependent HD superfamily phosphohydrolase